MLTQKPPPFATFPAFDDAGFNDFNPKTAVLRNVSAFDDAGFNDVNPKTAALRDVSRVRRRRF